MLKRENFAKNERWGPRAPLYNQKPLLFRDSIFFLKHCKSSEAPRGIGENLPPERFLDLIDAQSEKRRFSRTLQRIFKKLPEVDGPIRRRYLRISARSF